MISPHDALPDAEPKALGTARVRVSPVKLATTHSSVAAFGLRLSHWMEETSAKQAGGALGRGKVDANLYLESNSTRAPVLRT